MKQQQPISFYLDPVIWGDFQQPEPLTVLRALTSMQLPPRTVSFIMKGVKQSPHAAQHSTHTQVVRSDALRVTNDKHQSGRRRALAHSFSLSHLVTSTPPPPLILSSFSDAARGLQTVQTFSSRSYHSEHDRSSPVCDSRLGWNIQPQSLQELDFFQALLGHLYRDF